MNIKKWQVQRQLYALSLYIMALKKFFILK